MSILLVNFSSEKRDFFIKKCIANRLAVYHADRTIEIQMVLTTKEVEYIVIDLNSVVFNWVDYLKELRSSEDGQKYKLIACSNRQDKDFIKELLLLGIVGFIPTNLDADKAFEKMSRIINIASKISSQRQHFRVAVPPQEQITINFRVPNSDNFIKARLTDLSVVALAFRLDDPKESMYFREGDNIEKVQMKMDNRLMLFSMKIIKTGAVSIGKITEMQENALSHISLYIYKAMNGSVGNSTGSLATA